MILIPGKTYKVRYPGGKYFNRTLVRIVKGKPYMYDWIGHWNNKFTDRQQDVDSLINRKEIEECK